MVLRVCNHDCTAKIMQQAREGNLNHACVAEHATCAVQERKERKDMIVEVEERILGMLEAFSEKLTVGW